MGTSSATGPRVGVVGATGAVGRELLALLAGGALPASEVRALASRGGREVPYGDGALQVAAADAAALADLDLVFLSAGAAVARALAPAAVAAGAVAIDNSSAFRADPDVPLVVPGVNDDALEGHAGLIANPNCTAIVNALAFAPLHRRFRARRLVVSSYQAASGAGAAALRALEEDARAALDGAALADDSLAFDCHPAIGEVGADGVTGEEQKVADETRRLLDLPTLEVVATCVRVPVRVCHGVAATAWFAREVDVEEARAVLADAPHVVLDDVPTARRWSGRDEVGVGRLRAVGTDRRALAWYAAGDQLRVGAALNAVRIARRLSRA